MENRVYDIEMDEGPHVVIKFYRPGRWSRATIRRSPGRWNSGKVRQHAF
jgi:Ser/Thr protein kinase RdoA (MazF antagonist)